MWVVGFAAFHVAYYENDGDTGYSATLLDDFITLGPGTNDWCRTCPDTIVIRLTA